MEPEMPEIITLSDDEIEISFPATWGKGKQYLFLTPLFKNGWNRLVT